MFFNIIKIFFQKIHIFERNVPYKIFTIVLLVSVFSTFMTTDPSYAYPFASGTNYATGDLPYSLFSEDLDEDGDIDIVVSNFNDNNVSVFINNGSGVFAAAVNYTVGNSPWRVYAADVNGDTYADLITSNTGGPTASVLLNDGDGTFGVATDYATGSGPLAVYAADLDGDTDIDFATANRDGRNVSVFINNGSGVFAAAVNYTFAFGFYNAYDISGGDIDQDGDIDLAVAAGGLYSILKNNGNGTFAASLDYYTPYDADSIVVANFDTGDNYPEIALGSRDENTLLYCDNINGSMGSYCYTNYFRPSSLFNDIFAIDINGASGIDVLTASTNAGRVEVLMNGGSGYLSGGTGSQSVGTAPMGVSGADYNGDGVNDIAVVNSGDDTLGVYMGIGITVSEGSVSVSETGTTDTFTVVLQTQPTGNVVINVTSSDVTECEVTSGAVLTFTTANWDTPQTVTITGVDDIYADGQKSFNINLDLDQDLTADASYAALTLTDLYGYNADDEDMSVTVSPVTGTTTEAGGTATFTVVLDGKPEGNVIYDVSSTDATEGTVTTGNILTFTTDNWNTPQTITVTGVDDSVQDGNTNFGLSFIWDGNSTDPNYSAFAVISPTITNTDNDTAGVTVSAVSGNTTEAGGTATFTVVLATQPNFPWGSGWITFNVATTDATEGTVTGGETLAFYYSPWEWEAESVNWDEPQTVTVTGADDSVVDGTTSYNITLTIDQMNTSSNDSFYYNLSTTTVSLVNTDNETAGITVSAVSGSTTEAGGTATFTVVLDGEPTGDVVVNTATSDATEGTVTSGDVLTFTAANWSTPQTVTVTGADDSVVDGSVNYTILVTVDAANSADAFDAVEPNDVTVTNTDNDVAVVETTSGGGMPAGWSATPVILPNVGTGETTEMRQTPTGEQLIQNTELLRINNGANITNNRNVQLQIGAVENVVRMAISNTPDFKFASQENIASSKSWDLCEGLIECTEGVHTVYVKYFTQYGVSSAVLSASINYQKGILLEQLPIEKQLITRNWAFGNISPEIRALQEFLNRFPDTRIAQFGPGSLGRETTIYGQLTREAIRRFQARYPSELRSTGIIDDLTRNKLNALYADGTVEEIQTIPTVITTQLFERNIYPYERNDEVKRLQSVLRRAGVFSYPEDTGFYGQATIVAVRTFQSKNGIRITGVVGPQTREALNRILRGN